MTPLRGRPGARRRRVAKRAGGPPHRRAAPRPPQAGEEAAASPDFIVVGEVTRPHGVHGAVRILPITDFPERLFDLRRVAVVQGRGPARMVAVEHSEPSGRFVVMKFAGVDTPGQAAALRGATIEIPAEAAAPLPPGQFYVFQIVGLRARTPAGEVLGEVVDVLRTGSNDVYVVRTAGGRETLVPAVEGVIDSINLDRGEMIVRPPDWA